MARYWLGLALAFRVLDTSRACRFILYIGKDETDAEELLLGGDNDLLAMATEPPLLPAAMLSPRYDESQIELRNAEKNLDGYGVSWYADGEEFPRRVRSALPIVDAAGNADAKLMDLIGGSAVPMLFRDSPESCTEEPLKPPGERLRSRALFAHVRAASPGLALNEQNSHPFAFQTLTWLHNGAIWGFEAFRDELVASLPERVLRLVAGTTDSELAGAVFASHLAGWPTRRAYDLLSLRAAMLATVATIRDRSLAVSANSTCPITAENAPPSSLNFAVSDGRSLVVIRYRSSPREDPPTLYYRRVPGGVVVASEPSSTDRDALSEWILLGKNRMLSFSPATGVAVECVDPADCDAVDWSAAAAFAHASNEDRGDDDASAATTTRIQRDAGTDGDA